MSPSDQPAPNRSRAGVPKGVRWILALAIVAGGAYGAFYYFDNFWPYWHFRTVDDGAFYRSSQLNEADLTDCIERYGIKTILNLRDAPERGSGTWYATEQRVAETHGARLVDVPMPAGTPPSPEQVRKLLDLMDDKANLPVLVHCYHGTIRSAAVEGLYRREYMGESGVEAFSRVETWSRDLAQDYPLIADFIKTYTPRIPLGR